jgi:N-methylhydantoinase B/oxoprolinase/acetone carboxylase alpha subunit
VDRRVVQPNNRPPDIKPFSTAVFHCGDAGPLPGGGGFGDPAEHDAEHVALDVADGRPVSEGLRGS